MPAQPALPPTGEVTPLFETQEQSLAPTPIVPPATKVASETPEPVALVVATATSTPTRTALPTPSATPTPRFALQPGTPLGIANFVQPEAGCNWTGIGGQALDFSGLPVPSLVIEVGGTLLGTNVFHLALSGSNPTLGPGGFVIQLATQAIASDNSLWIQLKNLAGIAQSERVYFSTFADCEHNFILVNFSELTASISPRIYLPSILRNTPLSR